MIEEKSKATLIYNAKIVLQQEIIENGYVLIEKGCIACIGTKEAYETDHVRAGPAEQIFNGLVVDAQEGWLLPGFIDIHVHGGNGSDFMEAGISSLDQITQFHGRHGTTAMLATTVTASKQDIEQVLSAVHQYQQTPMPNAQLFGVHLEGPFLSPKWPGAQNPAYIVKPNLEWMDKWIGQYPDLIRMVTLAPETDGAMELIRLLHQHRIIPACGHSDANYKTMLEAQENGLCHAVHTFNAMTPLHHREPGTVGAILTTDSISAEVIADGHHVHPAVIRMMSKLKTAQNMILITDAISAAGLGDGDYELGGLKVYVKEGTARLKSTNSLAGSTLTMIQAFKYMVQQVGLSISQASEMASGNPAKLLGIDSMTGSIAAGKQADLVFVSTNFDICHVWVKGKMIH
ncbi:MAG TPA: N-acetylglucosamine-6-phosphate deacetylase [Bacilli bacterium]